MSETDESMQDIEASPSERYASKDLAERIRASHRKYLWQQRWERFREQNPLAWFFDERPPQEMYRSFRFKRSTRQEVFYHWLRQRTSWTCLSQLKTSAGVRFAAAAGLVSSVFQAAPQLHVSSKVGTPFTWLLLSGLAYLSAVVWFELFCPLLLKQALSPKTRPLGIHGRRWLLALVEDELRRWWHKREWWPRFEELDMSRMEDQTIKAIMSGYGVPAFAGFGPYAKAHIDQALDQFATSQKIKLWNENSTASNKLEPFSPGWSYEGNRPLVERLYIRHPEPYEIEAQPLASPQDLVLYWHPSGVDLSHKIPPYKDLFISHEVEGLYLLFEKDEHAIAFAEIIAHWQNSMYPIKRALLIGLYGLSVMCFGAFVITQGFAAIQSLPS